MDAFKVFLISFLIALLASSLVFAAKKEIKLYIYPVFGDHMVLQRGMDIEISGLATPGKKVYVEFAGQSVSAKASLNGEWKAALAPVKAGGPYGIKATCGSESITISDVLVGDVWFCSGQSNMEMRLFESKEGIEELKNFPAQPQIRLFMQGQRPAPKAIKEVQGSWTACDEKNAKNFSAVGYFFGKKLQKELNVPVGLIDSSWGGTSIEIWTDAKLIQADPDTLPIYNRWKANPQMDWNAWNDGLGMDYELQIANVHFISWSGKPEPLSVKLSGSDKGSAGDAWQAWAKDGSTAAFKNINDKKYGVTGMLSGNMALGAWGGAGVMLKKGDDEDLSAYNAVEFDARGKGKYSISLGQKSITDFNYYTSKEFESEKEWTNYQYSFKEFGQGNWGTKMPFTQNAIMKLQFNVVSVALEMPSSLYNGMVIPFTPAKIKGVIWYQGEANADRAYQYRKLLPMMIENWRAVWNEKDMPFYIVQLPNFMVRKEEPSESEWAELREAQLKTVSVPNTGVVSIIDLGDAKDIHPKSKQPVGDRLAIAALGTTYGKDITPMGPMYDSMTISGNKAVVKFKYTGKGLTARGGELKGFAVAGEDKIFKWAKAEIRDNTVVVWNDDVKEPKAVRYAWADNPECNLFSAEGLAAFPFRTDEWPGITDKKR
jgi:sialate O-acetylesterase